jgi:hypothetical protein
MSEKLKLYVWENVLTDWTPGIMFALASSPDEARALLLKKSPNIPSWDLAEEPGVITEPEGFVVWGGS